jgi:hypothetical protein
MVPRKQPLEKIYERDPDSNAFIISVAIESYANIFNELDPAPFRKKDLDQDLRDYLEDSSVDIPLKYDVVLRFNVSGEAKNTEKEEKIRVGLKTYFSFVKDLLGDNIRKSYEKSVVYVFGAFVLLSASYLLRLLLISNIFFSILIEGITIGGWVFLWEAISTFAFRTRDVKNRCRQYKRLADAPIQFIYIQKGLVT